MAEDSIIVTNNEPFPDAVPPAPVEETPPQPPPWEAKLQALERLTQQLQMDNVALRATVETTQRLRPPEPEEPPAPTGPPPRPQAGDYTDQTTYDRDMDTWLEERTAHTARQQVEHWERQRQRQAQEQALQQEEQTRRQAIAEREQALRAEHPDYDDRFRQVAQQASPGLYSGLQLAGARGPDLLLYLHAHPEDLARLNQLAPHDIPFALGQLLPQGTAPAAPEATPPAATPTPPVPTPPAPAPAAVRLPPPAPPQTVTAGGSVPASGYTEQMDQASYEQWRKSTGRPFSRR